MLRYFISDLHNYLDALEGELHSCLCAPLGCLAKYLSGQKKWYKISEKNETHIACSIHFFRSLWLSE